MFTTRAISLETRPLTSNQAAALIQLKTWLPKLQFEVYSRYLDSTVSQDHTLALAQVHAANSQTGQPSTWILASLPKISETIILAVFQEKPDHFMDFIASLDALSETADHIDHGFTAEIIHSVLRQRQYQSFTLCGFQALMPQLQLKGQKGQKGHTATPHYHPLPKVNSFNGLVVLFSQEKWYKTNYDTIDSKKFQLEAQARSTQTLLDIALPTQSLEISNIKEPVPELPYTPAELSIDYEIITQQDRTLLNRQTKGPRAFTYMLFTFFLLLTATLALL